MQELITPFWRGNCGTCAVCSERNPAVQASILQYARRITEAATEGQPAVDCVIAVPPWFGPAQRQALLDAGQVLGGSFTESSAAFCSHGLSAVHECTAPSAGSLSLAQQFRPLSRFCIPWLPSNADAHSRFGQQHLGLLDKIICTGKPFAEPMLERQVAGLNVLSLVNSHAAAALQYGIDRKYDNQSENVIFYDVGSSSVEARSTALPHT